MTLKVLENFQYEDAQAILNDAAMQMLPTPYDVRTEDRNHVIEQLMSEIRSTPRLKDHDTSRDAIAKIQDFLTKELTQLAFLDSDPSLVKARIGQRGDLRTDLYTVKSAPGFESNNPSFKQSQVEALVKNPDKVQHLLPGRFSVTQQKPQYSSLYAKQYGGRFKQTVLVNAHRDGDEILIIGAYRLFHDEVELSPDFTPLEVLAAFTATFGVPFDVAGISDSRVLFVDEEVMVPKDVEEYMIVGKAGTERSFQILAAMGQEITEGDMKILPVHLAFSIDTDQYMTSLRQHGYNV